MGGENHEETTRKRIELAVKFGWKKHQAVLVLPRKKNEDQNGSQEKHLQSTKVWIYVDFIDLNHLVFYPCKSKSL